MNYIQALHGTTKAFGWANIGCQSTFPLKHASTDNWKASKATVSGFNSMYADKCCGRMTQTTCTFHPKLSSWHIMTRPGPRSYYTVIHPKEICWCPHFLEGNWQAGRIWKERPLECGVQLSLRVYGIWCLFSHRQVSTFIITAASKILRDLMDLLLNFCHHLRLALSPTFEIGVPVYHHTWKQYLLDISKGAKMGHVWKGPQNPSVTIF